MNQLPQKPINLNQLSTFETELVLTPMNDYLFSWQKRTLDIAFTLLILPAVLPLLIFCMFLVIITMGFPVIFSQKRIGLNGRVFVIYKLRTLKRKSNNVEGITHSNGDITPLGKFLRIFRFDELPQIWNILRGEMSWVGPRPEVPYYVEKYNNLNPNFNGRLSALPGITGLAQLNNPNATPNDNLDKLEHDLSYISKANMNMDMKILFKTFFLLWK
ncbi:MAG: sugar transferase [Bacteroidales bacterium]|nr:sugar transferase [Bacteroidales bacterium]